MSKYYNKKRQKSKGEKIGFYTAFSICIIAVAMAVYSTYNTLNIPSAKHTAASTTAPAEAELVNGAAEVTVTIPEPTIGAEVKSTLPTAVSQEDSLPSPTEAEEPTEAEDDTSKTALQTMLSTELSLSYPTKSGKVLREYSEKSVYFKTLNVWRPHTGADFEAQLGEDVYAMCGGAVTKVYEDALYGKTVELSSGDSVCVYSGLGSTELKKGDKVSKGEIIGTAGAVPFEASEANHIHVAVRIGGKYADPLSFIDNDR